MKTFIRITEVWTPSEDRSRLTLAAGLYGDLHDFKAASEHQQFHYDEGLLGRVWLSGLPAVSEQRVDDAPLAPESDSLSAVLAIPVIEAGSLKAIVSCYF